MRVRVHFDFNSAISELQIGGISFRKVLTEDFTFLIWVQTANRIEHIISKRQDVIVGGKKQEYLSCLPSGPCVLTSSVFLFLVLCSFFRECRHTNV